jgi:DNA-binding beta-propeller fold protein YncE
MKNDANEEKRGEQRCTKAAISRCGVLLIVPCFWRTILRHIRIAGLCLLLPFVSVGAEAFVYIVVGAPFNVLRVIDTDTNLDARPPLALPNTPLGSVAVSPNGKLLYAVAASGQVLVVDNVANSVTALPAVSVERAIALSPDGRRLYGVSGTKLSVTDLTTGTSRSVEMQGIITYWPEVAVGPEGRLYWTQCAIGYNCALYTGDAFTLAVTRSVQVGLNNATGIAPSPDGKYVYVSASSSPHSPWAIIKVVSAQTFEVVGSLDLGTYGVGPGPIAVSPDGRWLYSLNGSDPSVTVIDLARLSIEKNISLGVGTAPGGPSGPSPRTSRGIAVTPDGAAIYVTNGELGSVSVIDANTLTLRPTLPDFGRADSFGNFVGPAPAMMATEYYNAVLDHHFLTASNAEIYSLDAGAVPGWLRTGQSFPVYGGRDAGAAPVCRFYIPPALGDSHFYSASAVECEDVRTKFPALIFEAADVFHAHLPDPVTGSCPPADTRVYRLWNKRVDSNHRYTTSIAVRDAMVAKGYIPEGYGPESIAMCAR